MSSTALVPIEAVGREIKARVEAGDKAMDKAEQHYIAAGIQLLDVHRRLKETREMRWSAFLFSHVRMSDTHARRYMALANGDTNIEEIREESRSAMRASRERAKERGGETRQISQSPNVRGENIPNNQQLTNPLQARIDRIVEALPAASLGIITQIERLLKLEESVNVKETAGQI